MEDKSFLRIGLRLEIPYETFGEAEREGFLLDLTSVTGCTREDIRSPQFWRGCVKFGGELPEQAVLYLEEAYRLFKKDAVGNEKCGEIADELKIFFEKYNISAVNGGQSVKLATLLKSDNADIEIILVHGWNGNTSSFGVLPEYLSNKTGRICRIYEYPTSARKNTSPFYFIAQNFDNWIRNEIGSSRFYIVAHSFGGIISRKFITKQFQRKNPLDKNMTGIVFVASPHTGTWLAKLANGLPFLSKDQIRDLDGQSPALTELQEDWQAWLAADRNKRILPHVRSIYGTDDKVVDSAVAAGNDAEAIPILGAGHTDIVKPLNPGDEVVKTIARLYQSASEA